MSSEQIELLISIAVIAAVAVYLIGRAMKRSQARTWPMEQGRVESTAVRLEGSSTQQAYYAEVRYSYTVQGQSYSGQLRRRFMRKGSADKWIAGYAQGRPLTVRYNSKNARHSMLFEREQAGAGVS